MKNVKNILIFTLVLVSVLSITFVVNANEDRIPGVFDTTFTLKDETIEKVNELAAEALRDYGYSVVVVFVDSVSESMIQKEAESYYYDNDFSKEGGIQLYIGVNSRKYDIFRPINGKSTLLTEEELDEIEDATLVYLRKSDFDAAVIRFVSLSIEKMGNNDTTSYIVNGKTSSDVLKTVAVSLVIGIVIGLIVALIMKSGMKTVKQQSSASGYMIRDSFNLKKDKDRFLYSRVTKVKKPDESSSGGGRSSRSSGGSHRSGSF